MESEPGAGTTFTLSLPLPEAESGGMTNLHMEVWEKPDGFADEKMVENWLRAMNNDPALEKRVLECIKKLPGKIGSLEDAILSNIQKDIKYIARDLKGVTGNLGMTEIHELAALIDEKTDRQDYDLRGIVKSIPAQYLDGSKIETPAGQKRKTDFKILLAEDNKINQKLVKRLINKMNLDCDLADNGKIALEKLKKEKYDLLLLDIQMPVMDGLETAKRIRSDKELKKLYVIALTASAIKGDAEKIIRAEVAPEPPDLSKPNLRKEGSGKEGLCNSQNTWHRRRSNGCMRLLLKSWKIQACWCVIRGRETFTPGTAVRLIPKPRS